MRNVFSLVFVLLGAALTVLAAVCPQVTLLGQLTLPMAGVFLMLSGACLVVGRHTMGLAFEKSLQLLKVLLTALKR